MQQMLSSACSQIAITEIKLEMQMGTETWMAFTIHFQTKT